MNRISLIIAILVVIGCWFNYIDARADRVILEKSISFDTPAHWTKQNRAHSEESVPIYVMLKNTNMDLLQSTLMEISHPSSPKYDICSTGQWMKPDEVKSLFTPSSESQLAVRNWLNQNGISNEQMHVSKHEDMIHIPAVKVKDIERIFDTEMYHFHHARSKASRIRSAIPYTVPMNIAPHLDLVGGLSGFYFPKPLVNYDTELDQNILSLICGPNQCTSLFKVICSNGKATKELSEPCSDQSEELESIEISVSLWNISTPSWSSSVSIPLSSMKCYLNSTVVFCYGPFSTRSVGMETYRQYRVRSQWHFAGSSSQYRTYRMPASPAPFATLKYLRKLYKIPDAYTARSPLSSQGVAEFLKQYYNHDHLIEFLRMNGEPDMNVEMHGFNDGNDPKGEASLDIQYMALARGVKTEFWSIEGVNEFKQEPFLKWVHELQAADGGAYVHSVSYGDDESSLSVEYMKRVCNEIGKIALLGRSVIVSSGDDGCGGSKFHFHPEGGCQKAEPSFPGTCPWVTTVGGTQISDRYRTICESQMGGITYSCEGTGEIAASTQYGARITSGGGFSNTFSIPDFQKEIMPRYLSSGKIPPNSFFNRNGRAYPDVSALSHNFPVYMPLSSLFKGVPKEIKLLTPVDGTSASAPTFAAMVSLWNDMLLSQNKPPLGFLNPWLYSLAIEMPESFNDITIGDNKCAAVRNTSFGHVCCATGFYASVGYDAVTGLGSPNFAVIGNAVLNPKTKFPEFGVQGLTGPEGSQGSATTSKGERTALWIMVTTVIIIATTILGMVVRSAKGGGHHSLMDSGL